eukprot:4208052-Amphidinium_carterae.2
MENSDMFFLPFVRPSKIAELRHCRCASLVRFYVFASGEVAFVLGVLRHPLRKGPVYDVYTLATFIIVLATSPI